MSPSYTNYKMSIFILSKSSKLLPALYGAECSVSKVSGNTSQHY